MGKSIRAGPRLRQNCNTTMRLASSNEAAVNPLRTNAATASSGTARIERRITDS